MTFCKAKKKFCLTFHYNGDNFCFFVNAIVIYKFKPNNKILKFPTQFCLGNISEKFTPVEFGDVSFKGNVYDSSIDYNTIAESDILNILKYLIVKSIII